MYVHLEAYTFMEEGNNETKIKNKYKDKKSNMLLSMNFTIKMFKKSELKYKNLVSHNQNASFRNKNYFIYIKISGSK